MEEVGGSPLVSEFSVGGDARVVIWQVGDPARVFSEQKIGDFHIFTGWEVALVGNASATVQDGVNVENGVLLSEVHVSEKAGFLGELGWVVGVVAEFLLGLEETLWEEVFIGS